MTDTALSVQEGDQRKELEPPSVHGPADSFRQPTIEPTEMFYPVAKQKIRRSAHDLQTSSRSGLFQMGQSPTGNVVRGPRVRIERCKTIESAVVWYSDREVPAGANDFCHPLQELDRI